VTAVVGSIAVALLIAEMSYRGLYAVRRADASYFRYGWSSMLSYDAAVRKGYVKLDATKPPLGWEAYAPLYATLEASHGFRTEPFDLEKPESEYRIVALGGSSTFNPSASYEESWPYVLQQKLNGTNRDGRYRVINAGVPPQTTYGVNRLLHDEIFSIQPDAVVIYSLFHHVFLDSPALEGASPIVDRGFRLFSYLFYGKSLVATAVIEKVGLRANWGQPNKMATYRYLLTEMVQSSHARGIKAILGKQLMNPDDFPKSSLDSRTRGGGVSPSQYQDFLRIVDEVCRDLGCVVADMSPLSPAVTKSAGDFRTVLLEGPVHLTREGNEVLADAIHATGAFSE